MAIILLPHHNPGCSPSRPLADPNSSLYRGENQENGIPLSNGIFLLRYRIDVMHSGWMLARRRVTCIPTNIAACARRASRWQSSAVYRMPGPDGSSWRKLASVSRKTDLMTKTVGNVPDRRLVAHPVQHLCMRRNAPFPWVSISLECQLNPTRNSGPSYPAKGAGILDCS